VPVRDLIDRLDARARSGDVVAACRLASELRRCREIRHWREDDVRMAIDMLAYQDLSAQQTAEASAALAAAQEYNRRVRANCAGLTKEDLRRAPRYAFMAAQAGHVPSMLAFGEALGVGGEELVADPELYALYRESAWPMFRDALEAGHPRAAIAWARVLQSRGYSFLTGVMPAEWQTPGVARALSERVMRELFGDPAGPARPGPQPRVENVSDEDRARADALYAAHFAGSRWMQKPPRPLRAPALARKFDLDGEMCAL
jgi:hypothetical protein